MHNKIVQGKFIENDPFHLYCDQNEINKIVSFGLTNSEGELRGKFEDKRTRIKPNGEKHVSNGYWSKQ